MKIKEKKKKACIKKAVLSGIGGFTVGIILGGGLESIIGTSYGSNPDAYSSLFSTGVIFSEKSEELDYLQYVVDGSTMAFGYTVGYNITKYLTK